jgi:hypothetical protein
VVVVLGGFSQQAAYAIFLNKLMAATIMTEAIHPRILLTRLAKSFAKKILPTRIIDELRVLRQLSDYYPRVPFDNTYPWLNWAFSRK